MAKNVDQIYITFGRDVVREVERRLDEDGSLAPILKKLGVPAMPGLASQHKALCEFMYRYGVMIFLKASQTQISAEEINKMKMQKLMGTPMLGAASKSAAAPAPKPLPAQLRGAQVQPARPAEKPRSAHPIIPVNIPIRVVEAMPRTRPAQGEREPLGKRDQKIVQADGYSGPERRTGKDRRGRGRRRTKQDKVWLDRRRKRSADRRTQVRREEDRAGGVGTPSAALTRPGEK